MAQVHIIETFQQVASDNDEVCNFLCPFLLDAETMFKVVIGQVVAYEKP